jgi:hypothetical protein
LSVAYDMHLAIYTHVFGVIILAGGVHMDIWQWNIWGDGMDVGEGLVLLVFLCNVAW